jgi:glycosyltransferase involved in cell wall biosynthesis
MKIGYLIAGSIPLLFPKGDSVHIHSFSETFIQSGGEIFIIRRSANNFTTRKKAKKAVDDKTNIRTYDIKWTGSPTQLQGLNSLLFNIRLYQMGALILKKEKPDILHEREIFLNFGGLLLANQFKIPYVLEVNAPLIHEVGKDFPPIFHKFEKLVQKKLFGGADRIITVSNTLKNYLTNYGVAEEKIRVVPNGVNEKVFHPNVSGEIIKKKLNLEDKQIVCFAGSLHQKWQGIDDLLRSAKIISSKKPSIKFIIVGGEGADVEILKKNAPDNVIFTGRVNHKEIPSYLAAADILIAPYNVENNFFYNSPIKLFEYMAMGKPIIASNLGQIRDVIEDGRTGLLNEPGNYEELAENILILLENEKLRKELGLNARKEVEKKYTWEQNVRQIISIYEEIL